MCRPRPQDRIDARRATHTASRCLLRLRFSRFPIVDFTERRAHKSCLLVFGQSVRETERIDALPVSQERDGGFARRELCCARVLRRTAFRSSKYFRTNFPSRAGSGPLQVRQVTQRSTISDRTSALTTW